MGFVKNKNVTNKLHIFLQEQLYKNDEAQIFPKIKNQLRTTEARLQMQM